jgi:hypothetical protein
VLNYLKAPDFEHSFEIIPKKIQQILVLGEIKTHALDEGGLTLDSSASSKLPVSSSSDTPDVCKRITSYVYLLSTGTCSLTFSQAGNNTYEKANSVNVTFEVVDTIVVSEKTTITCVKGKLSKKVTAVKPKCPTGYKQK